MEDSGTLSRRDFLRGAAVMATAALAAACAPRVVEVEKEVVRTVVVEKPLPKGITFWPEWGGKDADALQHQTFKFTEETGIAVDYLPIRDHARMIASMGAGNPPDLLMTWDASAVGTWGFNEAIIDLTPYIEGSGFDLDALHPLGVASGDLMGMKQIGLPLSNYLNTVLYYNKDAFEEAGLDPETPPETWEELWEMHQAITVVEDGQIMKWGYQVMQGQDGHPTVMNYGFGGEIYTPDRRTVTPDNDANIEALQWMRRFYEEYDVNEVLRWQGSVTTDGSAPTHPLYTGVSGMVLTGEWLPSQIQRLEGMTVNYGVGYMPYPAARPELKGTMAANSNPMIIPTEAENPDGAWQFIQFISRPENSAEMCVIVGNASPVKQGAILQAQQTENAYYKWMLESLWGEAKIKPLTINSPAGSLYMDVMSRERDLVLQEGKDPLEAMRTVKEEVQPELDAALAELGL